MGTPVASWYGHNTAGALAGNVIEMRRIAAHDRAECDDGVQLLFRLDEPLRRQRKLKATGHVKKLDVLRRHATVAQSAPGSVFQILGNVFIELRDDQRKTLAAAIG